MHLVFFVAFINQSIKQCDIVFASIICCVKNNDEDWCCRWSLQQTHSNCPNIQTQAKNDVPSTSWWPCLFWEFFSPPGLCICGLFIWCWKRLIDEVDEIFADNKFVSYNTTVTASKIHLDHKVFWLKFNCSWRVQWCLFTSRVSKSQTRWWDARLLIVLAK